MSDNLQKSKQNLKKALERLENAVEISVNRLKVFGKNAENYAQKSMALELGINGKTNEEQSSNSEDLQSLSLSLQDLKKSINN